MCAFVLTCDEEESPLVGARRCHIRHPAPERHDTPYSISVAGCCNHWLIVYIYQYTHTHRAGHRSRPVARVACGPKPYTVAAIDSLPPRTLTSLRLLYQLTHLHDAYCMRLLASLYIKIHAHIYGVICHMHAVAWIHGVCFWKGPIWSSSSLPKHHSTSPHSLAHPHTTRIARSSVEACCDAWDDAPQQSRSLMLKQHQPQGSLSCFSAPVLDWSSIHSTTQRPPVVNTSKSSPQDVSTTSKRFV